MRLSSFKKFVTKGWKRYYITTFFIIAFFFYTVCMYKTNFLFREIGYLSSFRLFFTFFFVTLTSLLIHEVYINKHLLADRMTEKKNTWLMILLNAVSAIFFYLYFYLINPDTTAEPLLFGRIAVTAYTIIMLFLSIGRTDGRRYGRHLWNSMYSIGLAAFFSSILFIGLSFLALMLNLLFELKGVDLYLNDYIFLMIVSGVLVFPLLFLSIYTEQKFVENGTKQEHKLNLEIDFVSRISLFYIVMPLLIVYTVVLYIYFFKQIFLMEFPNNVLAHLVIWFLFVTHVALYFLSGISGYKNEFEKWVILNSGKIVPALLIPITLVFISISIRLHYYGFTAARYFLLIFAIFNTIGLILLYFYRWRAQFAIVLLSIAILHISLYGALSFPQVTYRSQIAILGEMLAEAGYDLHQVMDGEISVADIVFDNEFSYRAASSIAEILNTQVTDVHDLQYENLKALQEHCIGYMYPASYQGEYVKQGINISAYNEDEVLALTDTEYIFRVREGEEIEIGSLVAKGETEGIILFDKENFYWESGQSEDDFEVEPVYYFDFSSNVIADEAKIIFYRDEFEVQGLKYEIFFIIDEFSYKIDRERKIVEGGYNHYSVQVIVRQTE